MSEEEKIELVFVPSIGLSHVIPTVQFAKLLLNHDHRFNVTFLLIPPLHVVASPQDYIDSVTNSVPNIHFISLPQANLPPPTTEPGIPYFLTYIQNYQPVVKQAITQLTSDSTSLHSVRLILDMFTASMVDVAKELNVPSYLYSTSGASFLGLWLLLPTLDSEIATDFKDHSPELLIPSYINPVPTLSLPTVFSSMKSTDFKLFASLALWFKETNGIIVNSFTDLETQAFNAFTTLMEGVPRVYPVGPLLDLEGKQHSGKNLEEEKYDRIMKWLDDQPDSSVVFLCFGTRGSMSAHQVTHIANGLESSGHRFLWSLRRPPAATPMGTPGEYTNPEEVLPDGFLDRIGHRGLVCGWVPQTEVLAHKATGAFVSHCGWNSTLESVWFGVPMVAWPLYAEQKMNAFQLVKDLGIAVEMREGYHREDGNDLVVAEDVERGVKCVMEDDSQVRRNMKEMSVKCRNALMEGGSSFSNLRLLAENLIKWK